MVGKIILGTVALVVGWKLYDVYADKTWYGLVLTDTKPTGDPTKDSFLVYLYDGAPPDPLKAGSVPPPDGQAMVVITTPIKEIEAGVSKALEDIMNGKQPKEVVVMARIESVVTGKGKVGDKVRLIEQAKKP